MTIYWAGPRVKCIARTQMLPNNVMDILEDWDTEWKGTLPRLPGGQGYDHGPYLAKSSAEMVTEFAGRVCYLSFGSRQSPRSTEQYVHNLLEQGHGSVFEHASWTLLLRGISRSLTHELIRHRVGVAISQLSQRYVDDPDLLEFVTPPALLDLDESHVERALFRSRCEQAVDDYRKMIPRLAEQLAADYPDSTRHERKKMAAEAVRAILPNATATQMVWTVNARALRNFLHKRGQMGVELEMRRFACTLARWLIFDEGMALFPDLRIEDGPDGREVVVLDHAPI